MIETRICIADLSKWKNNSHDIENIIECAESQETVMALETFIAKIQNAELKHIISDPNIVIDYYYNNDEI